MTGYDDITVFLCSHGQQFDLEVSIEIKIRRAPHELFLKQGVLHQFPCIWEIFKNQTACWENMIKKQSIVHKNLKYYFIYVEN